MNSAIADTPETSSKPAAQGAHKRTAVMLAIAVLIFTLSLSTAPSPAVDLFWQMRTGQSIAARHAVPHADTYSWTRFGHPWIVHEWGMCLLLWATYRAGGFSGVFILQAVLLTGIFLTLYLLLLRETRLAPITSACLTIWAAKLSSPLISPRPHLFTYLFLIIFMGIAQTVRRTPARRPILWSLVPLSALWANFHGGVIVGVALLAVFGICDIVESRTATHDSRGLGKQELIVAAACALALSLNPYGWHIYEIFGRTVGNSTMPHFVSEWSALDFHSDLGRLFEAISALIIAGMVFSRERKSIAEIATIILLAQASLTASRNVPLFAFAGLVMTARHIQSSLDRFFTRGDGGRSEIFGDSPSIMIAAVVTVAVAFQSISFARDQLARVDSNTRFSHESFVQRCAASSFALPYFPVDAVRFMKDEGFPTSARLYNDYNLGSYILWAAPDRKISISTQTDVFFGKVLDDYAKMDDLPFSWHGIVDQYRPDIVLLSAFEPQSRLFAASPEWVLCWADAADIDHGGGGADVLIFVRNTPQNALLIARCRRDCPVLRTHPEMASSPLLTQAQTNTNR